MHRTQLRFSVLKDMRVGGYQREVIHLHFAHYQNSLVRHQYKICYIHTSNRFNTLLKTASKGRLQRMVLSCNHCFTSVFIFSDGCPSTQTSMSLCSLNPVNKDNIIESIEFCWHDLKGMFWIAYSIETSSPDTIGMFVGKWVKLMYKLRRRVNVEAMMGMCSSLNVICDDWFAFRMTSAAIRWRRRWHICSFSSNCIRKSKGKSKRKRLGAATKMNERWWWSTGIGPQKTIRVSRVSLGRCGTECCCSKNNQLE
jgi:hypothetical protein